MPDPRPVKKVLRLPPALKLEGFMDKPLYAFFRRLQPLLLLDIADYAIVPNRLPPAIELITVGRKFDAGPRRQDVEGLT